MKRVLVVLFFVSLFWRMLFLQIGTQSLTHDEIDFYYSGYKLAHTGVDAYGKGIFLTSGYISAIPSIPVYISAAGWKLFTEKTPFNARFPFVLLNSITPILLFLIVFELTKDKKLSLLSFIVMSFSPWFSHISSRVPYDAPIALLFALASLYSLLSIKRGLLSIPLFLIFNFLSFNSYMGFKTVYPFFTMISLLIYFTHGKKQSLSKAIVKSVLVSLGLILFYVLLLYLLPTSDLIFSRGKKELLTPFSPQVQHYLWYSHWSTVGVPLLNKVIYNKITGWFFIVFSKYLQSFNSNIFFLTGEPSGIYGLRVMGLFFLTDLLFLVYGLFSLNKLSATLKKLLLMCLVVGGVPFAINITEVTVSLRGILLIFPYSVLIAYGMYVFARSKISYVIIGTIFFLNIFVLAYLYRAQVATISAENYYSTDAEMVREVIKDNEQSTIVAVDPYGLFMQYAFYSKNEDVKTISKQLLDTKIKNYRYSNVLFTNDCRMLSGKSYEIIEKGYCNTSQPKKNLVREYISKNQDNKVMFEKYKPTSL